MKLRGVLTKDKLDMIIRNLGLLSISETEQINLIETVATIVHRCRRFFNELTPDEFNKVMKATALIFGTLCDKQINPLCSKFQNLALKAFNNDIFEITKEKQKVFNDTQAEFD